MKRFFLLFMLMNFIYVASIAQGYFGHSAVDYGDSYNINGDYMEIDTSFHPGASEWLMVTHNFYPAGETHSTGFLNAFGISTNNGRYHIVDEKSSPIQLNECFNVLNPDVTATGNSFLQIASPANDSSGNGRYSVVDNAITNNNPSALLFITQNLDATGVYDTARTAVVYLTALNKWALCKENSADTFPAGSTFNVFVPDPCSLAFTHTATEGTEFTILDSSHFNNGDNPVIFITHQYTSGFANNHPIGVGYNVYSYQHEIYNEDGSSIASGTVFNVLLANVIPTAIDQVNIDAQEIRTYPVPASNVITIKAPGINTAQLIDLNGRVLLSKQIDIQSVITLSLSDISRGIYMVKLLTINGAYSQKIIITGNE